MTVPLTKVSNHILVLQILIVLDTQTDRQTFHENPHFVSVKGKTKKAVAFGLFVYPNSADDTGISYKFDSTWAPVPAIAEIKTVKQSSFSGAT